MCVSLGYLKVEVNKLNKGIKVLLCMCFIKVKVKVWSVICYAVKDSCIIVIYVV